tara:strand:- start:2548 stop:3573 length:1026 start_codon:yes stop_codon:yes gene_type:complete
MIKLFFIFVLIFLNKNVYSSSLFETSFYNVEFTSNNIETDKSKEINQIKTNTLLSIFKNILNYKDYEEVSIYLTEDLINTFIKNIVINDEKIINDKYISKIKINYNKKKIIEFLRLKKISYVEYHPNQFLLIIYENNGLNKNLLTKNNTYYNYFIENLENNNLFKIPNLDINDRYILKEDHIISNELNKLNNFFKKYNSFENIVIIANNDQKKINYNLTLYSNNLFLKTNFTLNKSDLNLFFEKLEKESLNLWKQINQIQNNSLNILRCDVNYFSMMELKEIRNNLNNISVINNLNIKSLSFKKINYEIHFYGNFEILFKILNLNKLKINYNEDTCVIGLI